jgi:hypothetical protein
MGAVLLKTGQSELGALRKEIVRKGDDNKSEKRKEERAYLDG